MLFLSRESFGFENGQALESKRSTTTHKTLLIPPVGGREEGGEKRVVGWMHSSLHIPSPPFPRPRSSKLMGRGERNKKRCLFD